MEDSRKDKNMEDNVKTLIKLSMKKIVNAKENVEMVNIENNEYISEDGCECSVREDILNDLDEINYALEKIIKILGIEM